MLLALSVQVRGICFLLQGKSDVSQTQDVPKRAL